MFQIKFHDSIMKQDTLDLKKWVFMQLPINELSIIVVWPFLPATYKI